MARRSTARGFGWRRDDLDHRDWHYRLAAPRTMPPLRAELTGLPPALDQGATSACTGYAAAVAHLVATRRSGGPSSWRPSALFPYWVAREAEGLQRLDCGSSIRAVCKALAGSGTPSAATWANDPALVLRRPTAAAYREADTHQALAYRRLPQTSRAIEDAIAAGCVVLCGVCLFAAYQEIGRDGVVPLPDTDDEPIGWHAQPLVGYDRRAKRFAALNSWGPRFGDRGRCYYPYDYLLDGDLAADFWVVATTEV